MQEVSTMRKEVIHGPDFPAAELMQVAHHILSVGAVREASHPQHPSREGIHKPLGLFYVLHVLLWNLKYPARVSAVSYQGNMLSAASPYVVFMEQPSIPLRKIHHRSSFQANIDRYLRRLFVL